MKIRLAIEWFLNPDHLPFIVGIREGIFAKHGIELEIIEPDEHYDGLEELIAGSIEMATNEPLHLIEQFHEKMLSLGSYFETKGGVLLKQSSYDKLVNGGSITVTTPVSNEVTNTIGFEIIRRFYAKEGVTVRRDQVEFIPNGFEHLKYMKEGADAGWLYFYNFEGIEAQHEGMDVIYMDAQTAGFANFSALDIFVNRDFYEQNPLVCRVFDEAVKESITFIQNNPEPSMKHYYEYSDAEESELMNDIISATMECFDTEYASVYQRSLPILNFFREIGITNLEESRFKTAFLA
jgi:ABC-type nitrate/sulfonate/bicarbonate transport system substrate-binding protein